MISWIALLPKLVSLFSALFDFARSERDRGLGRIEALASALDRSRMEVERATKARIDERIALERDPSRLHVDDGFKRPK